MLLNIIKRNPTQIINNTSKVLRRLANQAAQTSEKQENLRKNITEYRYIYPEFLPDPDPKFRNFIREKLEREDMIARRSNIDIPEFYVGTIMAVTSSDAHTPGKPNRFVGICIERKGCGLRSTFVLRKVIDNQGVEVKFEMYDPSLRKIEVLKLEKRLDDHLCYLRDAYPEFSTFDPNMEPEILPEGTPVPVNPIKVKLKPRPWVQNWERQHLQGVEDFLHQVPKIRLERLEKFATPWEKYDLVKEYMRTIPEEEQTEIFSNIQHDLQKLEVTRKNLKRKRTFVKPTKLA